MNATEWNAKLAMPVLPGRDHIRGSLHAAATLVEYGDYECVYCRAAHGVVNAILNRMQDRLCFVFRHFPLTTIHPYAQLAAEAAEAAGHQRKFWPMHDKLFTTNAPLTRTLLVASAASLALDVDAFESDLQRHVHLDRIREDFISGVRSGVTGTPAFYINGVRHEGTWELPTLLTALDRASLQPLQLSR